MRALLIVATACTAAATLACGQTPPAAVTQPSPTRPAGYLTAETAPDAAVILSPPPAEGSPGNIADHAVYTATRGLGGTPRWAMAAQDDNATLPAMYEHFACSLGVSLTPQTAPRLTRMLIRLARDTGAAQNHAKHVFMRLRPYQLWGGDICVPRTQSLDTSTDYPSGHATFGWSIGLILAELAPERATPILARARAFGESRAVCGMHSVSAVAAGRTTGAAVVAAEHGSAEFRADIEAARVELARLRAAGPRPEAAACRVETDIVSHPPYAY